MRHSKSSAYPFKKLRGFSESALPTSIVSRQPIRPFPEGGRSDARHDTIRAKCASGSTHSVWREGPYGMRPEGSDCAQLEGAGSRAGDAGTDGVPVSPAPRSGFRAAQRLPNGA